MSKQQTILVDVTMISAECHSDDHVYEVKFNAVKYFEQCTRSQYNAIIECDFGFDYPTDEIAEYMINTDPNVTEMFTYINKIGIGFECTVEEGSLTEWVKQHKPEWIK